MENTFLPVIRAFVTMVMINLVILCSLASTDASVVSSNGIVSVVAGMSEGQPLSPVAPFGTSVPMDVPQNRSVEVVNEFLTKLNRRRIAIRFSCRFRSSRENCRLFFLAANTVKVEMLNEAMAKHKAIQNVKVEKVIEEEPFNWLNLIANICFISSILFVLFGDADSYAAASMLLPLVPAKVKAKNKIIKLEDSDKLAIELNNLVASSVKSESHLVFPSVRFVPNESNHLSLILSTNGRYNAALVKYTALHGVSVKVGDVVVVESDEESTEFNKKIALAMTNAGYLCLTQGLWAKNSSAVANFYKKEFDLLFSDLMETRSYGKGVTSTPAIHSYGMDEIAIAIVSTSSSYSENGLIDGTDGGCIAGEVLNRSGFQFRCVFEDQGKKYFAKGLATRSKYVVTKSGKLISYDTTSEKEWGKKISMDGENGSIWLSGCSKTGGEDFTFKFIGLNAESFKGRNKKAINVGVINDSKQFLSVLAADTKIGNQRNDLTWQDVILNTLVFEQGKWSLRDNIKSCYKRILEKKLFKGRSFDAEELFTLIVSGKLSRYGVNSGVTMDAQYVQMGDLGDQICIMALPSKDRPFQTCVFKRQPQQNKASNGIVKAASPSTVVSLLDKVIDSNNTDGKVLTGDHLDFYNRLNADFKANIDTLKQFRAEVKAIITPSVVQKTIWISTDLAGLVNADNDGDYLLFSFDHDIIEIIKDQMSLSGVDSKGSFDRMPKVKNESAKKYIFKGTLPEFKDNTRMLEVNTYLNAPNAGQGAIGAIINGVGGLVSHLGNYTVDGTYKKDSEVDRIVDAMWLVAQELIDWQKYKYYLASLLYWHQWDRKGAIPNYNYVVAGKTTKSSNDDKDAAFQEIKSFDPTQWNEYLFNPNFGKMQKITDTADGYTLNGISLFTWWVVNLHVAYNSSSNKFGSFEEVWVKFLGAQNGFEQRCANFDKPKDALAQIFNEWFGIEHCFIDGNYCGWSKSPVESKAQLEANHHAPQAFDVRSIIVEMVEKEARKLGVSSFVLGDKASLKGLAQLWLRSEDHTERMELIKKEADSKGAKIQNEINGVKKEVSQTQILGLLKQVKRNAAIAAVERESSITQSQRNQTKESSSPSTSLREILGGLSFKLHNIDDSYEDLNYVRLGLILLLKNGHSNVSMKNAMLFQWEASAFELVSWLINNSRDENDQEMISWLLTKFIPALYQSGENTELLKTKEEKIKSSLQRLFVSPEWTAAGSVSDMNQLVRENKYSLLKTFVADVDKLADLQGNNDEAGLLLAIGALGIYDNILRFIYLNQSKKIDILKKAIIKACFDQIKLADGSEISVIKSRFEMNLPEDIQNSLIGGFVGTGLCFSVKGNVVNRVKEVGDDVDEFVDKYGTSSGYIYVDSPLLNSGIVARKYTQGDLDSYMSTLLMHGFGCAGNKIHLEVFLGDEQFCDDSTRKVLKWVLSQSIVLNSKIKVDDDRTENLKAYFSATYYSNDRFSSWFKPTSDIGRIVRNMFSYQGSQEKGWYDQDCVNYIQAQLGLPGPHIGGKKSEKEDQTAKLLGQLERETTLRSYKKGGKSGWSAINTGFMSAKIKLNTTSKSMVDVVLSFQNHEDEFNNVGNPNAFLLLPLIGRYNHMQKLLVDLGSIPEESGVDLNDEDDVKAYNDAKKKETSFNATVSKINIYALRKLFNLAKHFKANVTCESPTFSKAYLNAIAIGDEQE